MINPDWFGEWLREKYQGPQIRKEVAERRIRENLIEHKGIRELNPKSSQSIFQRLKERFKNRN